MKKQSFFNHQKNSPAFINLFIAGCVILSILLNGLAVKFSFGQESCDFFKQAINSQSAVLGLCTFSSIPLTIVYNLFCANRTNSDAGAQEKNPGSQQDNKKNTSSDFSITNSLANNSIRNKLEKIWGPLSSEYVFSAGQRDISSSEIVNKSTVPIGVFILLILALFIIPSRGAIEYSNLININRIRKTGLL